MRLFGLLLVTLAFGSIQAPILLEQAVKTQTFLGKEFTQIFSCSKSGTDILSRQRIRDLAETATQVLITYNGGSTQQFVYSKPETYAIRRLRRGETMSFQLVPPATGTINTAAAVINRDWVGPAALLAKLWNSCGSVHNIDVNGGSLYWACNNQRGLHLGPGGQTCMWDFVKKTEAPIEVYIDAGYRPNSGPRVPPPPPTGCAACRGYGQKRWTRIYDCNKTDATFAFSLDETIAKAKEATQVLINNAQGYYVTSKPGSYPIQQLRLGRTLSYQLAPENWALPEDIPKAWDGPSFLIDALWNACNTAGSLLTRTYHACNNHQGLHLAQSGAKTERCEWSYKTYDGPIEIFIDTPCTCPNEGGYGESHYGESHYGESQYVPPPSACNTVYPKLTVRPGSDGVAYNGGWAQGQQLGDKAFDGNLQTQWNAGSGGNAESGWRVNNWIIFSSESPITAQRLEFYTTGDTTHDVKSWRLSSANSFDGPWTVIGSGVAQATNAAQSFPITATRASSFYKLEFPERHSIYQAWVREIKLAGCGVAPPPPAGYVPPPPTGYVPSPPEGYVPSPPEGYVPPPPEGYVPSPPEGYVPPPPEGYVAPPPAGYVPPPPEGYVPPPPQGYVPPPPPASGGYAPPRTY